MTACQEGRSGNDDNTRNENNEITQDKEKDNTQGKDIIIHKDGEDTIDFDPQFYYISAAGGELITAQASQDRWWFNYAITPIDEEHPLDREMFYPLWHDDVTVFRNELTTLISDFYTATITENWEIKFEVEPNDTGKERINFIHVFNGSFGLVKLIQTAD